MPRETIVLGEVLRRPTVVRVGWQRDRDVQIGVEFAGDERITINHHGATCDVSQAQEFAGLWTNLTRGEVNLLIQQLRRARDQAYGRDE